MSSIGVPQGLGYYRAAPAYVELLRRAGLPDAMSVFDNPQVVAWRTLPDRENCTLDAELPDGRRVRLHVKRHLVPTDAVEAEAHGLALLHAAKIPTVELAARGRLNDGRSFIITEDLAGFADSEKLIIRGLPFARILGPTARLAAELHAARLHHRDLYLCHFFAKADDGAGAPELRLIDAARVRTLPPWPLRKRWIVKDLAQFWYSTLSLKAITDADRERWLQTYAAARKLSGVDALRRAIERKVRRIARHDAKLNEREPRRNISIPAA